MSRHNAQQSAREELARDLSAAYGDLVVRQPDLDAADALILAGYRKEVTA